MSANALMACYANPMRVVDGADFDGATDYLNRGSKLTGIVSSQKGIISFWIRLDGGDGDTLGISAGSASNGIYIFRNTSNKLKIYGDNSSGTDVFSLESGTSFTSSASWIHFLASWDSDNTGYLYINDVLEDTCAALSDDVDFVTDVFRVGRTTTTYTNGCLAEFYFAQEEYLDLSIVSNRRKFISASGKPVHLGTDGSLPTGNVPILYLHLDDGEAVANFAINRGTGGDLSVVGAPSTASTSPSD